MDTGIFDGPRGGIFFYDQKTQKKTYINKKKIKPLLFTVWGGTCGDDKPSLLLAARAASLAPRGSFVYLTISDDAINKNSKCFDVLYNYLAYLFPEENPQEVKRSQQKLFVGTSQTKYGNLVIVKQFKNQRPVTGTFEMRSAFSAFNNDHEVFGIHFNYGDNPSSIAMKLPYLSYRENKPNVQTHYISHVTLPMHKTDHFWSVDKENVEQLKTFKNRHKGKLMVLIAISRESHPFVDFIVEFFRYDPQNRKKVAFILLDGSKSNFQDSNVFISKYIEYEDVIKFSDFVLSGGGAGSVTVPMVYGIPQAVMPNSGAGRDKLQNRRDVINLKLGPNTSVIWDNVYPSRVEFFRLFVTDAITNYKKYLKNAQELKKNIQKHNFEKKLDLFLNDIQRNPELQKQVDQKRIPKKYISVSSDTSLEWTFY